MSVQVAVATFSVCGLSNMIVTSCLLHRISWLLLLCLVWGWSLIPGEHHHHHYYCQVGAFSSQTFQVRGPARRSSSRRHHRNRSGPPGPPALGLGGTTTSDNADAADNDWIEIPLLDVTHMPEYRDSMIQPLPSAHLPDELTSCHVYGLELTVPVFQQIVKHSLEQQQQQQQPGRLLGHVALRRPKDDDNDSDLPTLLGAIGCTAQILYSAPSNESGPASIIMGGGGGSARSDTSSVSQSWPHLSSTTVLCRGSFRFIVREITQTVPYTVARVQPLFDHTNTVAMNSDSFSEEEVRSSFRSGRTFDRDRDEEVDDDDDDDDDEDDDEDDDDDEYSEYSDLSPDECIQRTLTAAHAFVDLQLEAADQPLELSPLEASILQQQDGNILSQQQVIAAAARHAAQECAAVLQVFESSYQDLFPTTHEQWFAVAFLAAELCNLDNDARRYILGLTDSRQRLHYVCAKCDEAVAMVRARRVADAITQETDQASRDLRVGEATLPPWARQIKKGTEIEYYWNEDWGWCRGEVVDDPVLVVGELILTVYFFDDESTQRLPFSGDEKVRWRPASGQ